MFVLFAPLFLSFPTSFASWRTWKSTWDLRSGSVIEKKDVHPLGLRAFPDIGDQNDSLSCTSSQLNKHGIILFLLSF
ncbi:MAG: hypothetical protein BYD32DRAFT_75269 [Podila humilis]|nr:MAG: hypothetical protein BYD32DRAFT_75269 [Podila humilis]